MEDHWLGHSMTFLLGNIVTILNWLFDTDIPTDFFGDNFFNSSGNDFAFGTGLGHTDFNLFGLADLLGFLLLLMNWDLLANLSGFVTTVLNRFIDANIFRNILTDLLMFDLRNYSRDDSAILLGDLCALIPDDILTNLLGLEFGFLNWNIIANLLGDLVTLLLSDMLAILLYLCLTDLFMDMFHNHLIDIVAVLNRDLLARLLRNIVTLLGLVRVELVLLANLNRMGLTLFFVLNLADLILDNLLNRLGHGFAFRNRFIGTNQSTDIFANLLGNQVTFDNIRSDSKWNSDSAAFLVWDLSALLNLDDIALGLRNRPLDGLGNVLTFLPKFSSAFGLNLGLANLLGGKVTLLLMFGDHSGEVLGLAFLFGLSPAHVLLHRLTLLLMDLLGHSFINGLTLLLGAIDAVRSFAFLFIDSIALLDLQSLSHINQNSLTLGWRRRLLFNGVTSVETPIETTDAMVWTIDIRLTRTPAS